MSAAAIEAGKGFVRIYSDLSPLDKGLKQVEAKMQALGSRLSSVGAGVAGIGAGVAAIGATAIGGIAALSMRFADLGGALDDASQRTGVSASALSELSYVAEMGGTDVATLEKSISKLQKGVVAAAGGSKSMNAAFDSIGLSVKSLAAMSPEDQFLAVSKAIAGIPNPTARAAKAMELFGKSGTQLLPMITSDIEALREEARDLGLVISNDDAANAANLGDAIDRVKKSLGGIATQLGGAVAKPFAAIANSVAAIIGKVSAWVAANRSIVQTVAAVAAGFVVVGTIATGIGLAIIGVGATITAFGAIIGGIVATATAVFGTLAAVVGAILSPVGLVVGAIVGLGAYITYTALTATGSLTKLGAMFGGLASVVTTAWGGIVAAISTGDLQAAGEIAFAALEVGWLTITTTIQQVWANVSAFFVNTWLSAVESIVQIGASIYFGVSKYFDQLSNALVAGFDIAVTYITGAIDGIQTAIAKAIIKAQEFFGFFSASQSVQIQATLDQDLAKRARGRQSGLDQRANERGTALGNRDQQRRATADQFNQIVGEDFKRREVKVDTSGVAAAQSRLAGLNKSLADKSAVAVAKQNEQEQQSIAPPPPPPPTSPRSKLAQRIEAMQQRFAEKEAARMERFKTNQPEQFARMQEAQKAQEAFTSTVKSESGGSTGTFVSGVASSIAGGGVSPLEDLGKQQLDMLSSIDGRLREATVGEDD